MDMRDMGGYGRYGREDRGGAYVHTKVLAYHMAGRWREAWFGRVSVYVSVYVLLGGALVYVGMYVCML